jgi:3-hydroxyisobutyrate dehydrogenase-like beta-hydroxyacid dehydrogenase
MPASSSLSRVGWIGLGKMGLPICKRLHGAGFDVAALGRNAASRAAAVSLGLKAASTIRDAVAGADLVASAVSDDSALLDIVFADGGLRDSLTPGQIYLDLSTVSPRASARVAEAMAAIGVDYYRSPVSGSTVSASQGVLTAIVSGPAEGFERLSGFFASFARKAFLVGGGEEARYLKLAINSMLGATSALLAESLALARKGGLDLATVMSVVTESAVGSPLIQYKRDSIVAGDFAPAFSAAQMLKDLDLAAQAATETHCPAPVMAQIRGQYQSAVAEGLGDKDFFILVDRAARAAGL